MSLEAGDFTLERHYAAAPARVFAAWAIPEQRQRWNIHANWVVAEQDFNFCEGGEEVKRYGPPGRIPTNPSMSRARATTTSCQIGALSWRARQPIAAN